MGVVAAQAELLPVYPSHSHSRSVIAIVAATGIDYRSGRGVGWEVPARGSDWAAATESGCEASGAGVNQSPDWPSPGLGLRLDPGPA